MEVALQKNDSSCSTNSDGGSEDVELGERMQQGLLKKCDKNHYLFKVCFKVGNKQIDMSCISEKLILNENKGAYIRIGSNVP